MATFWPSQSQNLTKFVGKIWRFWDGRGVVADLLDDFIETGSRLAEDKVIGTEGLAKGWDRLQINQNGAGGEMIIDYGVVVVKGDVGLDS